MSGLFHRIWDACCSLGRHRGVAASAPTQYVGDPQVVLYDNLDGNSIISVKHEDGLKLNDTTYKAEVKASRGGRIFDWVTNNAGSRVAFVSTVLILVAWSIVGAVLGAPQDWQIIMQDASSIQCYISDTLLMRQQQNNCYELLRIIAILRSRIYTVKGGLETLLKQGRLDGQVLELGKISKAVSDNLGRHSSLEDPNTRTKSGTDLKAVEAVDDVGDAVNLPVENKFDRVCSVISDLLGSIYMVVIYWIGMFVWIGVGPIYDFSNNWQLWLNTVVAVFLTFTSMFLQNVRHRHMLYLEKCMSSILRTDCELEVQVRKLSGRDESNPEVRITYEKLSWAPRSIDWYAELIGSGAGVTISAIVFAVWIFIGHPMDWNSNWWLIIGTYTGLIGFLDGFVLRNVYYREDVKLDEEFNHLIDQDTDVFSMLGLKAPREENFTEETLMTRLSKFVGYICSLPHAVLFAVLVIIGLLAAATAMDWSETGQLLCNSPTMIIEGFLLIILIEAHNTSSVDRRVVMHDILVRRLRLLTIVRRSAIVHKASIFHTPSDVSKLDDGKVDALVEPSDFSKLDAQPDSSDVSKTNT